MDLALSMVNTYWYDWQELFVKVTCHHLNVDLKWNIQHTSQYVKRIFILYLTLFRFSYNKPHWYVHLRNFIGIDIQFAYTRMYVIRSKMSSVAHINASWSNVSKYDWRIVTCITALHSISSAYAISDDFSVILVNLSCNFTIRTHSIQYLWTFHRLVSFKIQM